MNARAALIPPEQIEQVILLVGGQRRLRSRARTPASAHDLKPSASSPPRWADAGQRADILQQLAERGIDFPQIAAQAGQPDADKERQRTKVQRLNAKRNGSHTDSAFSLQHSAFLHAPRRQRADRVKRQQAAFFNYYAPEAGEILNDLLEKYASDGELQFTLPNVLKVPPISQYGNVNEIVGKFGGPDQLRNAVNQLQTLLYAA